MFKNHTDLNFERGYRILSDEKYYDFFSVKAVAMKAHLIELWRTNYTRQIIDFDV